MGVRKINFEEGTRINNLTIIRPTEKRSASGSVKWLCICDCGQKCYIDSSRLKSGLAKSCGCLSKQALIDGREIYKVKNKIGQKYGRLTVIERDFNKEKENKGVYWRCICECGNYTTVSSNNLRQGKYGTQSCGKCHSSHGQNKIREILRSNHVNFIEEYRFKDCKDQRPLPFDFFVESTYIIEFDGMQHFKEVDNNFFNHQLTKKHDKIKNNYCKQNNIPIIRIPYYHSNIQLKDLKPSTSQFLLK